MPWPKTEHEEKLEELFADLTATFRKLDKTSDVTKAQAMLKDITNKLKDAKNVIKEFEMEARTDGMPAKELADRKRNLVSELNNLIALKKQYSQQFEQRDALGLGNAAAEPSERGVDGMNTQELMDKGRKEIQETDAALLRSEKIVEDTKQIGAQTAATLHDQTEQLNKIVDDLTDIEFNMKKASKVIRDIGRGMLTDKCISFLLFLVVAGVIAIVILKIIRPNKKQVKSVVRSAAQGATTLANNATSIVGQYTGRKMLLDLLSVASSLDYEHDDWDF